MSWGHLSGGGECPTFLRDKVCFVSLSLSFYVTPLPQRIQDYMVDKADKFENGYRGASTLVDPKGCTGGDFTFLLFCSFCNFVHSSVVE